MLMKRNMSALLHILAVIMLLIGPVCLTGCSSHEPEGGLSYVKIAKIKDKLSVGRDDVTGEKNITDDGYVCILEKNMPKDIIIPDEYEGLPVIAVTTRYHISQKSKYISKETVNTIQFGKNVKYLDCIFREESPQGIRELLIPESVQEIYWSFTGMKDAKVVIDGSPKTHLSFTSPVSVTIQTDSNESMQEINNEIITDLNVSSIPDYYNYLVGTKAIFDYESSIDEEAVLEQGKGHICEKLDKDKKISASEAASYARFADGPIVTVKNCPEISPEEYLEQDRDKLLEKAEPLYLDIAYTAARFAEDIYDYEPDSAAEVYFIAEKTGGSPITYYDEHMANSEVVYLMCYRISVRDIKTDELICWFDTIEGYVPDIKREGNDSFREGERDYLPDEDDNIITPEYCIHKYFK